MPVRLSIGDCVLVNPQSFEKHSSNYYNNGAVLDYVVGLIRYIGTIRGNDRRSQLTQYVGVEVLDSDTVQNGHNGTIHNYRYFMCPAGHGIHVELSEVICKLSASEVYTRLKSIIQLFKTKMSQYTMALNDRDQYIETLKRSQKQLTSLLTTASSSQHTFNKTKNANHSTDNAATGRNKSSSDAHNIYSETAHHLHSFELFAVSTSAAASESEKAIENSMEVYGTRFMHEVLRHTASLSNQGVSNDTAGSRARASVPAADGDDGGGDITPVSPSTPKPTLALRNVSTVDTTVSTPNSMETMLLHTGWSSGAASVEQKEHVDSFHSYGSANTTLTTSTSNGTVPSHRTGPILPIIQDAAGHSSADIDCVVVGKQQKSSATLPIQTVNGTRNIVNAHTEYVSVENTEWYGNDDDDDEELEIDEEDEDEDTHHRRTSQSNTLSTNTATITEKSPIHTNDDEDDDSGFDDEESLYSSSRPSFSSHYKLFDDDTPSRSRKKTHPLAVQAKHSHANDDDDDDNNNNNNQAGGIGADLSLFSQSHPHLIEAVEASTAALFSPRGLRARSASADGKPSTIPPPIAVQNALMLSIPTTMAMTMASAGPALLMSQSETVVNSPPDAVLMASEQADDFAQTYANVSPAQTSKNGTKTKNKKVNNQPKLQTSHRQSHDECIHKKTKIKKINSKAKKKQHSQNNNEHSESSTAAIATLTEAQSLKNEGFVFTAQYF